MAREYYTITGILVVAIFVVGIVGFINSGVIYTLPKSLHEPDAGPVDPSRGFIGTAISLVHTGTFNNRGPGYIGNGQRGPAYAVVLALGFLMFGEYVWPVYLMNFIFLALVIILLWRLSRRYLDGYLAFLPPLMLAVFPFSAHQVYGRYELFSLFLGVFSVFALLKYREHKGFLWLSVGTLIFTVWILERPIVLYFLPLVLMFLVFWQRSSLSISRLLVHMLLFFFIIGSVIGLWAWRNHRVLDTWQIGSGGHMLLRTAMHTDRTSKELISLALSYGVGDFIGSRVYAHYPENAAPSGWIHSLEDRWVQKDEWIVEDLDGEILTRVELDKKMYREAFLKIKERPVKFVLTGFIRLIRLNAPLNHRGQEIIRMFMGEYQYLSSGMKIMIILAIRLIWLFFLTLVLYAIARHWREWETWGILILLLLYYNSMHALLTHGEARYVVTVMPFYFLLFAEGFRLFYSKIKLRRNLLAAPGSL
ncbi:MAG: hypothetical protein A3C80_00590 [Candidatus Ryanbacteria bacterium RIFCSPHIGHO2_02_FULL_45_43]|uniref:Glycosyltransferase RgtA/B/C/D-like domain-containing protein n=1 Tax=Candidatus Ryanbacteria bacterium RIFCSPHIGHO2_01_45_13 TaxID=1802112 RepID=A0A1G2FYL1_9BACT|nr:MAG: hypothetical protein A2718_01980 [Candidatus Ryanbacteria bacterium RIFCSPHIGHO2_01_FULL_44_130]OGZ42700.1 MAG: hypothetical protein A2W41_03085 [Candidatus Ryanbacteria bacterium RIFCSPHIGHO2_01_45_13]OGZ48812.1 MAG: hypothetical protein A3C80_00590 [Candidatus Ryanbacteria bacterium RIFCSPHIGHO2_02_FULL_45_43]OGZ50844.1 MAG: hypothetical protein A3E55_02610 [Candidatus Ryanbacteria bacterium RIFCSPHIGHO2_12_FULL_44_20]OGZ52055.1 MAG: hypothetical protein A3A17_01195 [Candidatus Ryanba